MDLSVGPKMSTRTKAIIGVAVAGAAVVGIGALGYFKGKNTDAFIKAKDTNNKLGFFSTILEGLKACKDQVVGFFTKKGKKSADAAGAVAGNSDKAAEVKN